MAGLPGLRPDALTGEEGVLPPATASKRIALVIAHLGAGGAQRVVATAANALVELGPEVHILLLEHAPISYPLSSRVKLHRVPATRVGRLAIPIGRMLRGSRTEPGAEDAMEAAAPAAGTSGRSSSEAGRPSLRSALIRAGAVALNSVRPVFLALALARRTIWLRRTLCAIGPDAVLSFLTQTNILTILAARGLTPRIVISERNDPSRQRHRRRVEKLRALLYRRADLVTANSRGALLALQDFVPGEKLAFLPNPVSLPKTGEIAHFAAPTMISVGRLVEQKGIDILLAAFAKAAPRLPQWRLAIVGDGPLLAKLEAISRNLGIEERVDWHGHVEDPFPLLKASQLFVLTSRFEGTPNALLEAMACGLPSIVSDASPGPCELVGETDRAGLIVPVEDANATAAAMVALASDEPLRSRLAAAARARASEHEIEHALPIWLKLLDCE